MEVGVIRKLKLARFVEFGAYLQDKDEEVLLPKKYLPKDSKINDMIEVFLYHDSEGRVIATTLKPKAQRDEIAVLKVVDRNYLGCFLDLGIAKDLFMPTQNPQKFSINSQVLVFITTDKQGRLIAKGNIKSYLKGLRDCNNQELRAFSKVEIFPFRKSELGYECVINGEYLGLLHQNEVFGGIEFFVKREGYIKRIYPNGKCDLSLKLPLAKKDSASEAQEVLKKLKESGGHLKMHYDSNPKEIAKIFKMSKKSFKKALTSLIEQDKITLKAKVGVWLKV